MASFLKSLLLLLLTAACSPLYAQTPALPAPQSPATPDARDLKPIQPGGSKPQSTVAIPRSYALVIGISAYKNLPTEAQLRFSNRDAEEMYSVLISPEGGQFPAENVHKLINESATGANIRAELEQWLPSVTAENDRVLIYYAGHGFVSGGQAYLAPYDVDLHNIAATAYPMNTLGNVIGSRVKGKWKVLVTDACHSGAITPEADRAQVNQTLLDLHRSLFSLTASRDREQSFESADWGGGHGIFTYYVVQGLNGAADANADGVVSADELAEYVHTNVRQATHAQQNPTSERGSFDPNMVLAYNPTHVAGGASPVPQYGNLVIETNMDNTEVWVDGKSAGVVNKGTGLRLPGLLPGAHTIKGVRMGYEPDGPREEQVYPGQDTTVSIRILIARPHAKPAVDLLDKGMEFYNKGSRENYAKAAELFERAIAIDPQYSKAYLYLGRVQTALLQNDQALSSFQHAIQVDPDYMEARSSYAAALLDAGNLDEAVRQLDVVTRREPNQGLAWYLLSQAYARKADYTDGKQAAEQAVKFTPNNAEAHFWLAECERQLNLAASAEAEYMRYLELSNFESGLGGKAGYYLMGFTLGVGTKKRAAQTDIWRELRGQANLGICDCEWMQKKYDSAISYCQRALTYIPQDLFANYRLGLIYAEQFNQRGSVGLLAAARTHFNVVVAQNPDTNEADRARKYISNIDHVLAAQK